MAKTYLMDRSIYEFEYLPEEADSEPIERMPADVRRAERLVGVVRNARSHRNSGHPAMIAGRDNVILAEPEDRNAIPGVLSDFARKGVYYLVIDGGDGTIRDVLTAGAPIFGDNWPTLVVLPSGKTNALTVDLGMPRNWDLCDALDAIESGGRIERSPLAIRPADGRSGLVQGFILGGGAFTGAVEKGQDAHRWGAFNSVVVAVTAIWVALMTFFGSNSSPLRQGVDMRLTLWPGGKPMPHSGQGKESQRFFLLASTLERFPIRLKPFANLREGIRLTVMDRPRRRLLLLLPLLAFGLQNRWIEKMGAHRKWADEVEFETGARFILDGEAFPPGKYRIGKGPLLRFVTP